MSEIEQTPLYHELREKIALAAENQLLLFLNDEQLDGCVKSIYNQAYQMKQEVPGCELFFHIEVMEGNRMFIAAHHSKAGISVLRESKRIMNDVMSAFDYIVMRKSKENPDKELKTRTYLQDNKIVIEFL